MLLPGLALLAATVLIPAADDLADARWRRERLLTIESHQTARLDRAARYLAALDNPTPELIDALAAQQLNRIPVGARPLEWIDERIATQRVAGPSLEPNPPDLPNRGRINSRLERWATGDRSRLILIAIGAMCVLLGLMPPAEQAKAKP